MPYDKKWHMILSAAVCLFLGLLIPTWRNRNDCGRHYPGGDFHKYHGGRSADSNRLSPVGQGVM